MKKQKEPLMKNGRYSCTVYQSYNIIIIFCVKKTQKCLVMSEKVRTFAV